MSLNQAFYTFMLVIAGLLTIPLSTILDHLKKDKDDRLETIKDFGEAVVVVLFLGWIVIEILLIIAAVRYEDIWYIVSAFSGVLSAVIGWFISLSIAGVQITSSPTIVFNPKPSRNPSTS